MFYHRIFTGTLLRLWNPSTISQAMVRHKYGNFGFTEKYTVKYAGAAAMYFVSKKLKKKYNITDERKALYEAAETWVDALDGRDFLGQFSW
ncbi:hypothetical protein M8C21_021887 [Ambrosia artemisiifolia]|uniref:Uncharacterized protein n=1 Tax=Ambrosia artemisiifolia TaxID=4212 RepID=A0AAD5D054_AMBAR|nr:hypothetical protein M8C21_021887 [Ambrosia artemisiifolia]